MRVELQEITQINRRDKVYDVEVIDGEQRKVYELSRIGASPKHVINIDGKAVTTCAENYTPVPNKRIREAMVAAVEEKGYKIARESVTKAGTYATIRDMYLKTDIDVDEENKDLVDWGIAVTNSYDLTLGINVMEKIWRQICSNGLYGWGWGRSAGHTHLDKASDAEGVITRVSNSVLEILDKKETLVERFAQAKQHEIDKDFVLQVLHLLDIRRYEMNLLEERGIKANWKEGAIQSVETMELKTEYDLVNALTNLANVSKTDRRKVEIQYGLLDRIDSLKDKITIVPSL